MKKSRLLCAFLLILLILSSCKPTAPQPTDETTAPSEEITTPPASTDLDIIKNGKSEYAILVDMTNANAKTFAALVQDKIFRKSGVMLALRNAQNHTDYQKRIWVGDCAASATDPVKEKTADRSYSVSVSGNDLVLYADDWQGYAGMEPYLDTLFENLQTGSWTISADTAYFHDPASTVEKLQIATDGSAEYTLVYSSKDQKQWLQAISFATYLKNTCGIKISAKADSGTYQNEILLGDVDRPSTEVLDRYLKGEEAYFYGVMDGDYIIRSDSPLGIAMGIVQLGQAFSVGEDRTELSSEDNLEGSLNDLPHDAFFASSVALAKSVYGTYSSIVEKQIAKLSTDEQNDIKLVERLIERMGKSAAFCVGSSSALYDGYIVKLDRIDYGKVTKLDGHGHILIAADFAKNYFGDGVSADADGYVDISALCAADTAFRLYYDAALQIAVVTPGDETAFGASDAEYLSRMERFFHNPVLPEPDLAVEQTRVEVVGNEYDPTYIYDFTDMTYECYASPEILTVGDVIYISYDIAQMEFPNGTNTTMSADTAFAKSTDGGKTWEQIAYVKDLLYVAMTEHDGKIILLGNRKSNGYVWVGIYDLASGKLESGDLGFSVMGTAPTAVAVYNGRIYRAHNNGVISADLGTDLLQRKNWRMTDPPIELITQEDYESVSGLQISKNSDFWMEEGNVVLCGDRLYVLYRVDASPTWGYAAIFALSADGATLTPVDDPAKGAEKGLIRFPGNTSKFQIKYDGASGKYISFVSVTTLPNNSAHQRNVMYMAVSDDLFTWETVGAPLLVERQMMNDMHSAYAHAFQYISFDFSGDDILLLVREAVGNSCNYHNSNTITLYTFADYAAYIRAASAAD